MEAPAYWGIQSAQATTWNDTPQSPCPGLL